MAGALSDGKEGDGLQYMTRLKAVPVNGTATYSDSTLTVKGADEVLLFLTASTDYKMEYPSYKGRDFRGITEASLNNAVGKSYDQLYKAHVKEYADYFQRADLLLTDAPDTIPTDVKVQKRPKRDDRPSLVRTDVPIRPLSLDCVVTTGNYARQPARHLGEQAADGLERRLSYRCQYRNELLACRSNQLVGNASANVRPDCVVG